MYKSGFHSEVLKRFGYIYYYACIINAMWSPSCGYIRGVAVGEGGRI